VSKEYAAVQAGAIGLLLEATTREAKSLWKVGDPAALERLRTRKRAFDAGKRLETGGNSPTICTTP
jgi:hypothetical protein